jgi:hypothetical protein
MDFSVTEQVNVLAGPTERLFIGNECDCRVPDGHYVITCFIASRRSSQGIITYSETTSDLDKNINVGGRYSFFGNRYCQSLCILFRKALMHTADTPFWQPIMPMILYTDQEKN